jgi:hypothetical protein
MDALAHLMAATRTAYRNLEAGFHTEAVYGILTDVFSQHGLDANVAESAVDWLEGGTLAEDLTDALKRKET